MAKHRRAWSQETFNHYVKEGRGKGRGKEYKPWITIHDFASQGRSHRALGWKAGRVQHFMSDHEMRFLFFLIGLIRLLMLENSSRWSSMRLRRR
jgi:hypothetical protein